MEWVRRWRVRVTWDPTMPGRRREPVTRIAATPAELRHWVDLARADRWVKGYRVESIRVLDGEPPTRCRAGHPYPRFAGTLSSYQVGLPCCCGGHLQLTCRRCGDRVIEPAWAYDCDGRER